MAQQRILISAAALDVARDDPAWVIIDCRFSLADVDEGRRSYEQGHIPGSVFLDLDRDLSGPITPQSGRHPLPAAGAISRRLGELGIGATNTVVVYDQGNGAIAARAWWILRWLGHRSVFLLDGGYRHWQALGLPVETRAPERAPVEYAAQGNNALVVTTEELAADTPGIPALNLLDARDGPRFAGTEEPIDPVAGHVPGSINLPFANFLNPDETWRPLAERAALLEEALGSDRDVAWCVMCGSGVTACHLAISGLEAGFSEPQLYVGSWSEWIRDEERPVSTLKA